MGKIELLGMEFYAYHGYYPQEQQIGGKYQIDICIDADFEHACQTDTLEGTINYQHVYQLVRQQMEIKSKLLEHVAHRIAQTLQANFNIDKITVKLSKINPPIGGKMDKVSITVSH